MQGNHCPKITLTFEKIEEILGFKLPNSAREYQAWWTHEEEPKTHVQKKQWLSIGWKVKHYDLEREIVTFEKI
jgi:hypothetical protein